ncbi:hypothetical protein SC09_contig10orf00030 [Bacillus subtilis]|uniref:Uncharacterized protein n=1 Tax=Bacillus subtilis TaxID=1423 RepID=A0A0D1L2R6_BACIU|nr:hypothetical protein SC09_contig10orf00030 [Bacillus subtilis]
MSAIKLRNKGYELVDIQKKHILSDGTVWTLELGYTCYLKTLPLDYVVTIVSSIKTTIH